MKYFLFRILTFLLVLSIFSCNKTNSGSSGNGNNNQNTVNPRATPTGSPIGIPASKIIGAGGGTIVSADSSVELSIPPGALPNDTTITLQPITNNCPNGIMSAYRFGPNGLHFAKAATLTFHYPDSVLRANIPEFMGMAVQDSNGYWKSASKFTNDTAAHTISASIVHFTDYSTLELVKLLPENTSVKVNGEILYKLTIVVPSDDQSPQITQDEFEHFLLDRSNTTPTTWAVNGIPNGNSEYGDFNGGAGVTGDGIYHAPAAPPSQNNPVLVSVTANMTLSYNNQNYNRIIAYSHVLIYDGGYHVKLSFQVLDDNENGSYWNWTDSGSFDVVLAGNSGQSAVANIKNSPPTIVLDYNSGTCTTSLLYLGDGPIQILDSGVVGVNPFANNVTVMFNALDQRNYIKSPEWSYECPGGTSGKLGGGSGPPFPAFIQFNMVDSTQTMVAGQYTVVVTRIQ